MADVITDPKMKTFVHSSIDNDFGLSVDVVAEKCKSYGRFSAWLNSDVTRIKEVLNKVKSNGVSPSFFASYEKSEGYNSKWGWLNHTVINGNPVQDADSVSNWIVQQSKNTTDNPAWIDYGNPVDFVPQSVKTEGNADFKNMKSGSIGKVIIAGTAAATWAVYYPNGLKKEYNQVQDYADPITVMYKTIEEWGGKIEDENNGGNDGDDYDNNEDMDKVITIVNNGETNIITNIGNIDKNVDLPIGNLLNDLIKPNLYKMSKSFYSNNYIKATIIENLIKLKATDNFSVNLNITGLIEGLFNQVDTIINDEFTDMKKKINDLRHSGGNPNPDPDPEPSEKKFVFPVHKPFRITQEFKGSAHFGVDFAGPNPGDNVPIYSVADGTVTRSYLSDSYGECIMISHTVDNVVYETVYAHMVLGSRKVSVGDTVKQDEHIGTMGTTGQSTGVHLHFEFHRPNWNIDKTNALDPMNFLEE